MTAWTSSLLTQGKLSLHNDHDGTEHVFTLGGVGEHPLPVDHVLLQCSAGQTTHTVMNVPNYSQNKLTLKVQADMQKHPHKRLLAIKVYYYVN